MDDKMKSHKFESLVVTCIECERLAARWRCLDCRDLYCTSCFTKMHSRGKKIRHKYESLRYYTPGMHRNFEYQVGLEEKRKEVRRRKRSGWWWGGVVIVKGVVVVVVVVVVVEYHCRHTSHHISCN